MRTRTANADHRDRPRGFTLVELLVVITIIALLIGLLIPAVSMVRRTAKNTSSKATIQTIATGLETFKASDQVGGRYPPSASDYGNAGDRVVISPYDGTAEYGNEIPISGAGLLVWALSGADLLGTPGFKVPADLAAGGDRQWGVVSHDDDGGLYEVVNGEPQVPRYGPFVPDDIPVSRRSGSGFVVPAEAEARGNFERDYPMYLDAYDSPILYLRADPAGKVMADIQRGDDPRGIYHYEDIEDLVVGDERLILNKAGKGHQLGWDDDWDPFAVPSQDETSVLGTFQYYIRNENTQAKQIPQKDDSFLLISPGYDGRYGTADDITNFDHHGI